MAKNPNAVALGRLGGLAGKGRTSPAKAAAARLNGKKGGRPKLPGSRIGPPRPIAPRAVAQPGNPDSPT